MQSAKACVDAVSSNSHALELLRRFCIPVILAPAEPLPLGLPLLPEEGGLLLVAFLYCAGAPGLTSVCTLHEKDGVTRFSTCIQVCTEEECRSTSAYKKVIALNTAQNASVIVLRLHAERCCISRPVQPTAHQSVRAFVM